LVLCLVHGVFAGVSGVDCYPREHSGVALLPYQCVCLAALRCTVAEETGVEACKSALDHEIPQLLEEHEVVGVVARPVARFRRIKAVVEHKCLQRARLQHHACPISQQTHRQHNIKDDEGEPTLASPVSGFTIVVQPPSTTTQLLLPNDSSRGVMGRSLDARYTFLSMFNPLLCSSTLLVDSFAPSSLPPSNGRFR
jgi:hypothetical protein